jgi:hypothetical protein
MLLTPVLALVITQVVVPDALSALGLHVTPDIELPFNSQVILLVVIESVPSFLRVMEIVCEVLQ